MTDESLLKMLAEVKYELYDMHGHLLDRWANKENAGALILFVSAQLLKEDFAVALQERYPDITIFSLILEAGGPESASYCIFLTQKKFFAISLYGRDMTPEQFMKELVEFDKNEIIRNDS